MKYFLIIFSLLFSNTSFAKDFINISSIHNFDKTVETLVETIKSKNLKHFTTIEHHKGAQSVGLNLRPTSLIIFGNPKVGTLLMQESQSTGLDLPLKFLVSQDKNGKVMVTYRKVKCLKRDHKIRKNKAIIKKMKIALAAIASSVHK